MSNVVSLSTEELLARRAEVLDEVSLSLNELQQKAMAGMLVGAEWDAWQRVCDIEFLLGSDPMVTD